MSRRFEDTPLYFCFGVGFSCLDFDASKLLGVFVFSPFLSRLCPENKTPSVSTPNISNPRTAWFLSELMQHQLGGGLSQSGDRRNSLSGFELKKKSRPRANS